MAPEQVALPVSAPGSLTIFRYTDYDVPFWARSNTRAGRWNEVGDGPTQYWSLTSDAAWAELIRAKDLYTEQELEMVRMPIWACRIPAVGLLDLHDATTLEGCGLTPGDLVADDWRACQQTAPILRAEAPGIITPCVALDGHANVTLFGPRRAIDWRTKPALVSTVPACKVAVGRPPPGLIDRVRRPIGEGPPQEHLF